MPRKRKDPSILETAVMGRWPVAAMLCAAFFVGGLVVVPGMLSSNAIFRPMAATMRMLALIPVLGFGALAVFKFLRESKSTASTGATTRTRLVAPGSGTRESRASFDPSADPIDAVDSIGQAGIEPALRPQPDAWSLALLQSIEWKRFEEVVAAYFRAKNFRCETVDCGPDGGVDGRLYFGEMPATVGVVQCKAWGRKPVGVAQVRELLGVMTHEKVGRGYFYATGEFSADARSFAAANPIKLIGGRDFLEAIAQTPDDAQRRLLDVSTAGDYTTPTCPSCGIKLVERVIGGRPAWGCRHFPRCKSKIFRKAEAGSNAVAG